MVNEVRVGVGQAESLDVNDVGNVVVGDAADIVDEYRGQCSEGRRRRTEQVQKAVGAPRTSPVPHTRII